MSGRLDGRVAIITGGARGIGEGVVRRFAAEGAKVIIADLLEDQGSAVAAEIGGRFVAADVTRPEDWTRIIAEAQALGGLDILVNNAGGGLGPRKFVHGDIDHHRAVMELNLSSVWLGMHAAIPAMRARGGGSIINISSIDGLSGMATLASYSAAKFGVTGMTRSVALEVGGDNIRVNAVHPGFIETPLLRSSPEHRQKQYRAAVAPLPISRLGKPAEVAGAVLFFACDDSSYCTGTSLLVDGGHLAGSTHLASAD
jgi:3alpha(or 20beta)-hydroxysteroid dehydrogenase